MTLDPIFTGSSVARTTLLESLKQFDGQIKAGTTPVPPAVLYPADDFVDLKGKRTFDADNRYFSRLTERFPGATLGEMVKSAQLSQANESRLADVWQGRRDAGIPSGLGFATFVSGALGIACLGNGAPAIGLGLMLVAAGCVVGANVPHMMKSHHEHRGMEAQYFASTVGRWGQALESARAAGDGAAEIQHAVAQIGNVLSQAQNSLTELNRRAADATARAAAAHAAAKANPVDARGHLTQAVASEEEAAAIKKEAATLEQQIQEYSAQLAVLQEKSAQASAVALSAAARRSMADASLAALKLVGDTSSQGAIAQVQKARDEADSQSNLSHAKVDLSGVSADAADLRLKVDSEMRQLADTKTS